MIRYSLLKNNAKADHKAESDYKIKAAASIPDKNNKVKRMRKSLSSDNFRKSSIERFIFKCF